MRRAIVRQYDAVGGPASPKLFLDGFVGGPTDPGKYRVAFVGPHSSTRYAGLSTVRWGSPIREEKGHLVVLHEGHWRDLEALTRVPRAMIVDLFHTFYPHKAHEPFPTTWVLNSFGHTTCYLYKDLNNNGRLDRSSETIHGEFLHTTFEDAAAYDAKIYHPPSFLQVESHGCVHLKPIDLREMLTKKYIRRNGLVVFYEYAARAPGIIRDPGARGPYELHFFPGIKTLYVVGRSKL